VKPKILLFDIETAPSLGWYFDLWKEGNIVGTKAEWYMLCFAAKWLDGKMMTYALPDYKGYKPGSEDDKQLVKELWRLFDEADILVAHNGDYFDIRKANARFSYYNLPPPSPYKTVDTLKVARKYFNFTSNKLDALGKHLGYGSKLVHTGFHLWKECMNGDKKAWKHMIEYNKRDVILLEKIYLHFRPWISGHPNVSVLMGITGCPACGSKNLMKMGTDLTQTGKVQQYRCKECGKWSRGKHTKVTNIR
jgi:DNA polymerase elongation subunit (family B)